MVFLQAGQGHPLAVLSLQLAVVGALTMVNAQAPPPPQLQLLKTTTGRSVPPTAVITIAIIAFFVLVLFCVFVNLWRRSSADASAGARHGSIRKRRRGLDPAALAALPVVPYAEIRKHKSGGGVLECAVCLTAFDDGDELRLLPQCSHAFHPECIDPWLEGHVTCPLCRGNLEKPVPLPSPDKPPRQMPEAVAVRVEAENDEERKEEDAALEKLRCARRAARMPRSRSTGPSASTTAAAETGDHERFTVRLPPHVREEVLRSRRLRHATSLVITLGGGASNCAGSWTACSAGGERCVRRRWASLLSRTASWSWAQGGGEASAGKKGAGPETGVTRRPPCGHVVCTLVARWPARCKAKNLA
uniref:RING-type E3 ubiquitin transferase n=2 Tax=Setaria italica TaxID=4555 RepID=K3Z0U2_SETIT